MIYAAVLGTKQKMKKRTRPYAQAEHARQAHPNSGVSVNYCLASDDTHSEAAFHCLHSVFGVYVCCTRLFAHMFIRLLLSFNCLVSVNCWRQSALI
jgi:hypothetical protein